MLSGSSAVIGMRSDVRQPPQSMNKQHH